MPGFFARFRRSENGQQPENTPRTAWSSRLRLILLGTGLLLIAGVFVGVNAYLERNCQLWVVNGLPKGMLLLIDDHETLFVSEQSYRDLWLPEGRHRVVLVEPKQSGPAEEFELRNTLQERFFPWMRPRHVLAPGRTAALIIERERQSEPGAALQVVSRTTSVGRFFATFRDIDLPFLDFPVREKGDSHGGSLEKTSLYVSREAPAQFVTKEFAATQIVPDGVLSFAEAQLLATPSEAVTLNQYMILAIHMNQGDRALDFVGRQLSKRPLWHEWHRVYQAGSERLGRREELIRRYDALVAQESKIPGPAYSGMLYLRGRLERDDDRSLDYMRKAVTAHSGNYLAWYATGFIRLSQGKIPEAEEGLRNAFLLRTIQPDYRKRFLGVTVALGKGSAVQRLLNIEFNNTQSADLDNQCWLLDAILAAGDNPKAVEAAQKRFARMADASQPGDPQKLALKARLHLLYLQSKFNEIVDQSRELGEHALRHQALFELGRLTDLPASPALLNTDHLSINQHLLLAVAWRQQGRPEQAAAELRETLALLQQGSPDEQLLAAALQDPKQVTLPQLQQITIDPLRKALALLTLVQDGAPQRKELLDLAATLNYSRHFPHHFVARTVTALRDVKKGS